MGFSKFFHACLLLGSLYQHSVAASDLSCGEYDVLIVGAGFSGLAAAKQLKDAGVGLTFRIVEFSDHVGGRVSSVQPEGFDGVWVEEGAGWITDFPGNPMIDLVNQYGTEITLQDFFDFKMFEYDETSQEPATEIQKYPSLVELFDIFGLFKKNGIFGLLKKNGSYNARVLDFRRAYRCVSRQARKQFRNFGTPPVDNGFIALLADCGWTASSNSDFAIQWIFANYEYAENDISLLAFPEGIGPLYLVVDQEGGYQSVADKFAKGESIYDSIDFETNVANINYAHDDSIYHVKVDLAAEVGACDHYLANYVILTVSVGVLEHNLITFEPELFSYDNPLKMKQYVRIYYKFNERVGPDYNNEFLYSILNDLNVDNIRCINWQNLDATRTFAGQEGTGTSYIPGSNIWECTMTTESFAALLAEGNGEFLTEPQIDALLTPLRRVFPQAKTTQFVDYVSYYPDLNLRGNFGFGAYSNWEVGKTLRDYYEYYGGGPLIERCQHNGCDNTDAWRLHISGTGSCFEQWETVHGAYFAGQRSANYVLAEMGLLADGIETTFYECDDFFENFVLPDN